MPSMEEINSSENVAVFAFVSSAQSIKFHLVVSLCCNFESVEHFAPVARDGPGSRLRKSRIRSH
ncbi:MAG: hypothetical protein WAR76_24915, partial [Xanthobacteraceae bacterium]